MSKSIVGLIAENQSSRVVSIVEKTLAKKLLEAIAEQKSEVARQAYGTLEEYFGGDEQPDYVNQEDNAYAVFFANALKKFGVNGPEDFRDDVTKQRFFDYVDHNWRAQDSVQTPLQGAQGGSMELGTQTQLPAPATPPMAPTAPGTSATPTTAQGNDPSLATMAPAGPSINKTSPLDQSGQDPTLNGAQNAGPMGSPAGAPAGGGADQYGGAGAPGAPAQDMNVCPYCKGSGKAACPTCGRPHGLDAQQGAADEQDPDLEIGPEGSDSEVDPLAADDEIAGGEGDGLEGGEQDPNGEMIDGGMGDEMGGDEEGDPMAGGDEQQGGMPGEEEDVDDPFDDEDAYTIDASDFDGAGGGDEDVDSGNGDEGEDGFGGGIGGDEDQTGDEGDEDESGNGGFGDEDQDQEDLGDDDEDEDADLDNGGDEEDDDGGFPQKGGDEDPDLEVGDDDDSDEDEDDDTDQDESGNDEEDAPVFGEALKHRSWSRKERKADSKKPVRAEGKKQARLAEDFGLGLDDAEDAVWLNEAALMMQAQPQPVDPGLNKIISYVQNQLSRIKKLRNSMLMQLRRERAVIKKDPALGPEEKMEAMKQLASMAKDNRKFFKTQAKLVKAMFTGKLSGGGMDDGGDEEMPDEMGGQDQGMDQDQDQDQGFPPQKKGGFPPAGDDGDDEEDPNLEVGDEDQGDDDMDGGGDDDESQAPSFPPKKDKGGFPPKKKAAFPPAADDDGGDEGDDDDVEEAEDFSKVRRMPTFDELKKKKFGQARLHNIPPASKSIGMSEEAQLKFNLLQELKKRR